MIKAMLERRVGHLSCTEFEIIMGMVTEDIKFNNIRFRKCTSMDYILDVATISILTFRRCA